MQIRNQEKVFSLSQQASVSPNSLFLALPNVVCDWGELLHLHTFTFQMFHTVENTGQVIITGDFSFHFAAVQSTTNHRS